MDPRFRTPILILLLVAGGGGATVAFAYFFTPTTCSLGDSAPNIQFTVIESAQGYNGSKNQVLPWPVMTVHCGQTVTIHVRNDDTAEAHGFAVTKYAIEIILRPGESHDVMFIATQAGSYRIFCTIPCLVHTYMLSGQLIVTI